MKKRFILTALATLAFTGTAAAAVSPCEAGSDFGAGISIELDNGKLVARIDGDIQTSVLNISNSCTVNSVVYTRNDAVSSKPQTFVSPFSTSGCTIVSEKSTSAKISLLNRIYVNTQNEWKVEAIEQTSLEAHKPYIFVLSSDAIKNGLGTITFGGDNCVATFVETENIVPIHEFDADANRDHNTLNGTWQFIGTYASKQWTAEDPEIGPNGVTYGFAAKTVKNAAGQDSVFLGKFVKAGCNETTGNCPSVAPLRAYLKFVPAPSAQGKPQYSALAKESAVALPDEIEVEFVTLMSSESPSVSFIDDETGCFKDSIDSETGNIREGYKSIEFKMVNGKRTACIDGFSRARFQTVNIPQDVEVDTVIYNRVFPTAANQVSTIMLPFDTYDGCVKSTNFYKALRLTDYGQGAVVDFGAINSDRMGDSQNGSLVKANTPYLMITANETMDIGTHCWTGSATTQKVVLNTSGGNSVVYLDNWEFRGTYEQIQWNDGNSQLGRVYGFSTKNVKKMDGVTDSISVGQFVKGASGASVPPMRAYLYYNRAAVAAKAAAGTDISTLADEDLPETISVRFLDADGKVMSIGQLNTVTGEVNMNKDLWFDLKGRQFNKKPTIKGTYYNQGRKVIIK